MGSASKRTSEPSLVRTSLRGLSACPKWERIEASSFCADSYSPSPNPVDSTALPLRKTHIRNGVTTSSSLKWSIVRAGVNRMLEERWDCLRSQGLG